MTTATRPAYAVIAELRDGTARYLNGSRAYERRNEHFTTVRRWARKHATYEAADEEASRLNCVAAGGHYWREVAYFRVARTITRRKERRVR